MRKLRDFVEAQFNDVPLPCSEEIFDPSDPDMTESLREKLTGRDWRSLGCGEASNLVSYVELSPKAYRYYVQAQLLCTYESSRQGCYPEEMGFCRHDFEVKVEGTYRRWTILRQRLAEFEQNQIMTKGQIACLALHVELYCLLGDDLSCRSHDEFWKEFAIEGFFASA